jgi:hypothetical protein
MISPLKTISQSCSLFFSGASLSSFWMQFSMNMVVTYMNMAQDDDLIPFVDWLNQHTTHEHHY